MTKICFGSTKMEIFYWEKAFHAGKKFKKNDFAPSENFSCYAPDIEPGIDKSCEVICMINVISMK